MTWVVAVLAAVVALVAGGTVAVRTLGGDSGSSALPASAAVAGDTRAAGVNAALALMTRGLRTRSEGTFLTAITPRDAALRARQRAFYRGLTALPLKEPQVTWDGERMRAPARPGSYPPGTVVVLADVRYLLDGWDDETVDDGLVLTMAPAGSRWLVVGDGEAAGGAASRQFVEPWSTGASLVVERRAHVLAVGDASHRSDLRRLADRLEDVTADVRAGWPEPSWNGRVVAYAATDPRFVEAWFDAQAATGPPRDRPGAQPTWEARVGNLARSPAASDADTGPPRLVVTPYVLTRTDSRALSTLRHEVTHVATARTGRPVPGWLAEGAAEYTGFRLGGTHVDALRTFAQHGLTTAATQALRRRTWTPQLLNDRASFYSGNAGEVAAGYLDGWIASLYVADRYGDAALRRLYDTAATQPAAASWDAVDAAALRAVLGTDHAHFVAAVRSYGLGLYRRATGT